MRFEVVTLFPEMIEQALSHGVVARARGQGLMSVGCVNPRDFATDVHRTVDDRPYGGGPGMVMKPEPLVAAIELARGRMPAGALVVALSAQGRPLTRSLLRDLRAAAGLVLVAGRYEGIDQRVIDGWVDMEVSVGDFVVSGGELPALVMIDALTRLIPGALGDARSSQQESFEEGLLDWPHFTRPEVFRNLAVPPVLASGDHEAIGRWRLMQAVGRTWLRRPDLLSAHPLDALRRGLLEEFLTQERGRPRVNRGQES